MRLLVSAPAHVALADRQRFPTVVSFSYADVTAYGAALVAVLRRFAWMNVAVISDSGSTQSRDKVAEIYGGVLTELTKVLPDINFLTVNTDDRQKDRWTSALQQAQIHSRS